MPARSAGRPAARSKIEVTPRSRAIRATPYPAMPKNTRLPKAHDAGVPPHTGRTRARTGRGSAPRRVDRQIVLRHERRQRADHQHDDFDDRQHLPSARAAGTKREASGRRHVSLLSSSCQQSSSEFAAAGRRRCRPVQHSVSCTSDSFRDRRGRRCDDLIIAALGNRRIHLHLAVPLAGTISAGPPGPSAIFAVIQRRGDRVAIELRRPP